MDPADKIAQGCRVYCAWDPEALEEDGEQLGVSRKHFERMNFDWHMVRCGRRRRLAIVAKAASEHGVGLDGCHVGTPLAQGGAAASRATVSMKSLQEIGNGIALIRTAIDESEGLRASLCYE